MNRPAPVNYVVGNPLILLGFTGLMFYFGWLAWIGEAHPLAPVIMLAFASASHKANERIREYASWKKRWDSYSDASPSRLRAKHILLMLISFVSFFVIFAAYDDMTSQEQQTTMAVVVALGLMLAGLWFCAWIFLKLKRRPKRAASDAIVSICLPKPSSDPKVIDRAYAALPPHCQAILRCNVH